MEFADRFIHLVKYNRCLYDINHKDFSNMYKTNMVWARIAKQLKVRDYIFCKRKWQILCTYFKAAQRSNAFEWKYYKKLKFLEPYINYSPAVHARIPDFISHKVIQEVKKYECLYNPRFPENADIKARSVAWEKVSKALNLDVIQCKRKWRNLRDGYLKRRRAMLKIPLEDVHPWRFYQELEFLNCVEINTEEEVQEENVINCVEEDESQFSMDELEEVDMNKLDQLTEQNLNWNIASAEESEHCLHKNANGDTILWLHHKDANDLSNDSLSSVASIEEKNTIEKVDNKFAAFIENTNKMCNELAAYEETDGLSTLFASLAMSVNQANLSHKQIIQLQQQTCSFVFEKIATYSAINISLNK